MSSTHQRLGTAAMRANEVQTTRNTRRMQHDEPASSRSSDATRGGLAAEHPVLAPAAVIARAHAGPLVDLVRIKLGFPAETFAGAVRPVIDAYAAFVQLLPVAGSLPHRRAGGRLVHGLESALRALDRRRGRILPQGALPEVIGTHAHRWSYAVFAAAMLHGVADTVAGLRVVIYCPGERLRQWEPLEGDLITLGAIAYRVALDGSDAADPARYRALPARVFEASVPGEVRAWLAGEPRLMAELMAWLSGHDAIPDGALAAVCVGAAGVADEASGARRQGPVGTAPLASARQAAAVAMATADADETIGVDSGDGKAPGSAMPMAAVGVHVPASEPAAVAQAFLAWLGTGMAEGTIRANEPGALVHGVSEGLLLMSPRVFRAFAKACKRGCDVRAGPPDDGTDRAKWVQREVLRAGWHLQGADGVNLLTYEVWQRDQVVSRLFGVVIREPARFLDPPPINPALRRAPPAAP
jgi:hypothetical protein